MTMEAARKYLEENKDKLSFEQILYYRIILIVVVGHYELSAYQYWNYLRETQGTEFLDILYSPREKIKALFHDRMEREKIN